MLPLHSPNANQNAKMKRRRSNAFHKGSRSTHSSFQAELGILPSSPSASGRIYTDCNAVFVMCPRSIDTRMWQGGGRPANISGILNTTTSPRAVDSRQDSGLAMRRPVSLGAFCFAVSGAKPTQPVHTRECRLFYCFAREGSPFPPDTANARRRAFFLSLFYLFQSGHSFGEL